jgi:hypothetical protein
MIAAGNGAGVLVASVHSFIGISMVVHCQGLRFILIHFHCQVPACTSGGSTFIVKRPRIAN